MLYEYIPMWKELVSCEDGLTRQVLLSSMDTNSFTSVLGHPTVRFVFGGLPPFCICTCPLCALGAE